MADYQMADLLATLPRAGRLEWIGVRPARRAPMLGVAAAHAEVERGLRGDHYAASAGGRRQVTLIQAEHLPVVAALCGREALSPEWLRRNLLVSGINLLALKDRRFSVGEVLLEGSGLCQPCSRMEEVLGPGGYNAMRGHGGIVARVLRGGILRLQDAVIYDGAAAERPADPGG